MKKILSLFFVLSLALISLVTLSACDKNKTSAADLLRTFLLEEDGKNVKEDFSVPSTLTVGENTYDLTWTSNNQNVVIGEKIDTSYLVKVSRPAAEETATLTVSLTAGKKDTATKDFLVYLSPISVYDFVDEFSAPGVFEQNGTSVTKDFALATEYALAKHPTEKATISWTSSNEDALAISEDGATAIVSPSSEEVSVFLTAVFTYKGETSQARFKVVVASPKSAYENLMYWYNNHGITQKISGYVVCEAAVYSESYGNISLYLLDDTLQGGYYLYRTKIDASEAAKLYDENGKIKLGVHVTVTGASNTNYSGLIETNAGGNLVVDENIEPINVEDTYYAMDNDILANAQSLYYRMSTLVTLTNWKVKKVGDPIVAGSNSTVLTLEKAGVEVVIRYSKYVQDALGEENAAAFQAGLAGIAAGDYVNVKGLLSYYNTDKEGYDQKSYQVYMVAPNSVTKGTEDETELPGTKVGAALKAFDTLQDLYVAPTTVELPAEVAGVAVTWAIPESNVAKSVALEGNALKLTPQSKLETVSVVATYTNGAYSTVVYYSFKTQSLNDAEMIDKALEELVIEDQSVSGAVTLPAGNELFGVTYTYALKETTYKSVSLASGVLTVNNATLTADEKVVLVVTATKGSETKTVEVEITVHKLNPVTVADFLTKKDKDNAVLLAGVITAVNKVGESGSFVLTDAAGTSIFCYSGLNVALGDEVEVLGKYTENYSFPQINEPVLVSQKAAAADFDVTTVSGTKNETTAQAIATYFAGSSVTNESSVAEYSGKYYAIKGYVYELESSKGYVKMSVEASSKTEVVRIYFNSGLKLGDYVGQEITVLCFARGTNPTNKYITVQAQGVVAKELTAEEKVEVALNEVKVADQNAAGEVTLPTASTIYTNVTFTYALVGTPASVTLATNKLTVVLPAEAETVTLKVTATDGTKTKEKEITFKVSPVALTTIAAARALEDGVVVKVKGTVVAITSRGYVLWDSTDAVYVYAHDGEKVYYKVGDYVEVIGKTGTYNGEQIIPSKSTKLTEGTPYTGTPTVLTGAAMDAYIAGTEFATTYVEMTGTLAISGSYYNVTVDGATTATGSLAYVADEFKDQLAAGTITVRGWSMGISKSSGTPKFYNLAITEVVVKELTDADKVAADKEALTITSTATSDITLPAAGTNGSVITWASSNTAVIANDGKVTQPTTGDDVEVKLTATLKLGEVELTKEFTVTVLVADAEGTTVAEVYAAEAGDAIYTVNGYVVALTSKGFMLQDATGTIYVLAEADAKNLAVGDDVTVLAVRNDNVNTNSGWTIKQLKVHADLTGTSVTKVGTTTEITATPKTLTVDNITGYKQSELTPEYVVGEFYVVKSGNYYNLLMLESDAVQVSVNNAPSTINLSGLVGKAVVLKGYTTYFTGGKYLYISAESLEVAELTDAEKIAYDEKVLSMVKNVEDELTLPSTGVNGSTITWASDNEEIISIANGEATITQPAAGSDSAKVKLTATISSGEATAKTKEFEVTVAALVAAGSTTVTLKTDNSTDYVAKDSTTDYATKAGLDADIFSMTFAANSCTNNSGIARFHNSNGIQLYGASNKEGASFTVTATGATISKIEVTLLAAATFKVNGTEYSGATTHTILLEGATSFTFQTYQTSQVKIASIVITYAPAE